MCQKFIHAYKEEWNRYPVCKLTKMVLEGARQCQESYETIKYGNDLGGGSFQEEEKEDEIMVDENRGLFDQPS